MYVLKKAAMLVCPAAHSAMVQWQPLNSFQHGVNILYLAAN